MGKSLFVFVKDNRLFARLIIVFTTLTLSLSWLTPLMMGTGEAATAQITQRSVVLGSAKPSASTSYSFTFTTATSGYHLDGIKLIACTTAYGSYPGSSCTIPTGFSFASATYGSKSGFTDAANFTIDAAGANDCVATGHPEVLCLKRTSAGNDTAGVKTLVINAVTNPSTPNTAYYLGITTYNANTWPAAGEVDAGTVATAVVQTLTVNAQVAEILNFCVGSTSVDDATSDPTNAGNHDCAQISGTSVNLGVLDSSTVNISPWSGSGGDSKNGIAMVRTNAANGVAISYDAIQATSGTNHLGTLRLSGANCDVVNDNTDGCINAAGTSQTAFVAGQEMFGMTVAGINSGSTTSYTPHDYAGGNTNLKQTAQYIGGASNTSYGASAAKGFAWDETGTAATIATSASSTIKQVDDEALILKFAATSNIITPFGQYSVQADFVAVPTY